MDYYLMSLYITFSLYILSMLINDMFTIVIQIIQTQDTS